MDVQIGGILVVALVMALVEVAKRLGLPNRLAPVLAIVLGAAILVANAMLNGAQGPKILDACCRGSQWA